MAHGARRGGMISDNKKLAIMHAIMRVGRCLRGIERRIVGSTMKALPVVLLDSVRTPVAA